MSKKNIQDLLKEIQKLARPAPGLPPELARSAPAAPVAPGQRSAPPAPGGVAAPRPAHRGIPGTNPAVKNMQLSMQNLAKMISATINYDTLKSSLHHPEQADGKQFTASYGRDAFSNFMVNRYLRNADTKGVDFDSDPTKTKMEDKNPTELKNMSGVLDSLNRIGKGTAEFKVDGVWGQRTNNALKNVAAIAESVMKLGQDLGMQSKSFDVAKLAQLAPLIPAKDTDITPQEKTARAGKIAELLDGVQLLFKDFKSQVFNKPEYKVLIDGEEPVFKFGPGKKKDGPDVSGGEKAIYDDLKSSGDKSRFVRDTNDAIVPVAAVAIPPEYTGGKQLPSIQLTGADLVDRAAFEALIARTPALASLQKNNPDTFTNVVKLILDQTKKQVSAKLALKSPEDIGRRY